MVYEKKEYFYGQHNCVPFHFHLNDNCWVIFYDDGDDDVKNTYV
jgi:hypothetical protein